MANSDEAAVASGLPDSRSYVPIEIPCRSCGRAAGFDKLLRVVTGYRPGTSLQVVVCPDCGMTFLNPQYQFDAYADYYQNEYYASGAKTVDEIYASAKSNEVFKPYLQRLVQLMPGGGKYLDVGAGTGQWLDYLRDVAPQIGMEQIHVLEPSDLSADFVRRRYPSVSIQRKMLEDNDYPDGFFDGVLCSALIEHFTDPLDALFRFNRIIGIGGHLMLLTPNFDEHSFAMGPQNVFKFPHTFYYTRETLGSLLEKSGFAIDYQDAFFDPNYTWYGFLIVIAKKTETRQAADLERRRVPSLRDADNAKLTKIFLSRMGGGISRFRNEYRLWSAKKTIKKFLPWLKKT